jgi:hypothetical protein
MARMSRGRGLWGVRVRLVALAAISAALVACGAPSTDYVKDPSGTLLLKLPAQWTVFDQTQLYRDQHPDTSFQVAENATTGQWTIGFDGAAKPAVGNLLTLDSSQPSGFVKVRPVQASEQESLDTYAGLRNLIFGLDKQKAQTPDLVQMDSSRILHFPGGYRTLEVTFGLRSAAADPFTRFTQIAAVDSNVQNLYLLVIGCAASCYDQNQHAIDDVLNSWTLKES